ncbi:hypothetical protein [Desulfuribacillus alkaliarsenatis]|uniref:Uncharacterized protein n=1 Tax=Desulfuribacillus alkaliarsenatis TaxID=766136 RepID=A0A1E5G3D6_9FIRM|nr:hypothetical protein [Desulfuribacillus alkaliarsenatis]OEF97589.1 hypothetical protein BHF68_14735 [Desulfuribacillus alkaliarsenatis]
MQQVKSYLDEIFRELPNSRRAKELKSDMLADMEERYQELIEHGKDSVKVEKQLIDEIGTADEIRENINLNSGKSKLIFIAVQLLIFITAFMYKRHVELNHREFISSFNAYPIMAAKFVATPLMFFIGMIIGLQVLNYLNKPREIFVKQKWLRVAFLIASFVLIVMWGSFAISSLGIYRTFSMQFVNFMIANVNVVAGAAGVLFYLGVKK